MYKYNQSIFHITKNLLEMVFEGNVMISSITFLSDMIDNKFEIFHRNVFLSDPKLILP